MSAGYREVTLTIDGVLNGRQPFRADFVYVDPDMVGGQPPSDPWESVRWCVVDAEDSILAVVAAGEEMAVYLAHCLNELEGRREQAGKTIAIKPTERRI